MHPLRRRRRRLGPRPPGRDRRRPTGAAAARSSRCSTRRAASARPWSPRTSRPRSPSKGQRVLLLDADTVTGHVPTSLGMDGVPDGRRRLARRDRRRPGPHLRRDGSVHTSGHARSLPLTSSPMATELLEPQRVAGAIAVARRNVDYVIVDAHPSYSPLNRAMLEQGRPDPRPGHARHARDPGARPAARRGRRPRHASTGSRSS